MMAENTTDTMDSISALDREDVVIALLELSHGAREMARRGLPLRADALTRVATALAEHLIDRHD